VQGTVYYVENNEALLLFLSEYFNPMTL